MPNISDYGILLGSQLHGEDQLKILVLTENHGINSGFIKITPYTTALYQLGNLLELTWINTPSKHFCHIRSEIVKAFWPYFVNNRTFTYSVRSIVSLLPQALSELQPHHELFYNLLDYLQYAGQRSFSFLRYIKMELNILDASGYGINIDRCVLTGTSDHLEYVAPELGGALTATAKQLYHGSLLLLPQFLVTDHEPISIGEKRQAFILTSYFFRKYLGNLDFSARTNLIKHLIIATTR